MSPEKTLQTVLIDRLREMYHSEQQFARTLPKLIKSAKSPEVREVLERRLRDSADHLVRLEVAFDTLDRPDSTSLADLLGFAPRRRERPGENPEHDERLERLTRDAGIMADAQREEHHHIATYHTLATWADALGHPGVARLLSASLESEEATEHAIDKLAGAGVQDIARAAADPHASGRQESRPLSTDDERRLIRATS